MGTLIHRLLEPLTVRVHLLRPFVAFLPFRISSKAEEETHMDLLNLWKMGLAKAG
jgi:hypothetical protein